MRLHRSEARRTGAPEKTRCKVETTEGMRCKKYGYGGYCHTHTPPEGNGVTKCYVCGLPVALHKLGDWCW